MTVRPVLVTQRMVVDASTGEHRDVLDQRWAAFLERAGLVPLLVPSASSPAWLEALSEQAVGLLLTGGNDLATVNPDPQSAQRDALERMLVERFVALQKPVMGVCRGLQLLAAYVAGLPLHAVEGHAGTRHAVIIPTDTRWLAPWNGTRVNSFHRFAPAGNPGPDWVVTRAEDGSVEALEHRTQRILGIMWHPERETPALDNDIQLFRRFMA
jgi:gamma-glutamyl-gamma-aminobutyrate hydrolase PuuD